MHTCRLDPLPRPQHSTTSRSCPGLRSPGHARVHRQARDSCQTLPGQRLAGLCAPERAGRSWLARALLSGANAQRGSSSAAVTSAARPASLMRLRSSVCADAIAPMRLRCACSYVMRVKEAPCGCGCAPVPWVWHPVASGASSKPAMRQEGDWDACTRTESCKWCSERFECAISRRGPQRRHSWLWPLQGWRWRYGRIVTHSCVIHIVKGSADMRGGRTLSRGVAVC